MNNSLELHNDEEKMAFNLRAKASMDEFLRAKTWVEKVKSIERMNRADRLAKEGMRKTLAAEKLAQAGDAEDVGG